MLLERSLPTYQELMQRPLRADYFDTQVREKLGKIGATPPTMGEARLIYLVNGDKKIPDNIRDHCVNLNLPASRQIVETIKFWNGLDESYDHYDSLKMAMMTTLIGALGMKSQGMSSEALQFNQRYLVEAAQDILRAEISS